MSLEIAKTIVEQMGGNLFIEITGVNAVGYDDNVVAIDFKEVFKNDIETVKIELTANDTYNMTFFAFPSIEPKIIAFHNDVFCDQLLEIFECETGFNTNIEIDSYNFNF